jgi:DNA-binding transcriptional ArsR family regulator
VNTFSPRKSFLPGKAASVLKYLSTIPVLDPGMSIPGLAVQIPPIPPKIQPEEPPVPQTRTTPDGITQQLAKALAHPLRVRILTELHKGISSPNQLSQELGEPLGNVSYHVKTLLEFDCVELVKTEPRRGAVEHFYRATERAFFNDNDWAKIPASARKGITGVILESVGEDATAALTAGTIEKRTDSHITRTPLSLDEKGWKELNKLLNETLERANEIQDEATNRLAKEKGAESIPTKLALLAFETPSES